MTRERTPNFIDLLCRHLFFVDRLAVCMTADAFCPDPGIKVLPKNSQYVEIGYERSVKARRTVRSGLHRHCINHPAGHVSLPVRQMLRLGSQESLYRQANKSSSSRLEESQSNQGRGQCFQNLATKEQAVRRRIQDCGKGSRLLGQGRCGFSVAHGLAEP